MFILFLSFAGVAIFRPNMSLDGMTDWSTIIYNPGTARLNVPTNRFILTDAFCFYRKSPCYPYRYHGSGLGQGEHTAPGRG